MQVSSGGKGARTLAGLALVIGLLWAAVLPAQTSVAVLPFDLVDTSVGAELQGSDPDAPRRLQAAAGEIRQALAGVEGLVLVDPARVREGLAADPPSQALYDCNGCERRLGRALGADWVVVGWVQKVSDLILNLNVVVRRVADGAVLATGFVDLRGNNDRSWQHATGYVLKNALLPRVQERLAHPPPPLSGPLHRRSAG